MRLSPALALAAACCACDPQRTSLGAWQVGEYLEAEAGDLSGFTVGDDSRASGTHYIAPPADLRADGALPGSARARYQFTVAADAVYTLWGRLRAPDAASNRVWFQLDGEPWRKWRLSTGEIWFWAPLHDDFDYGDTLRFELSAGQHTLTIANCVDGVWFDRWYIAAEGDEAPVPANDTLCRPPHSIDVQGECVPSCGSQGGNACSDAECEGVVRLVAYDCVVCCSR
ncbi:MAG: hypothetical protein RL701_3425 [Pseudomonadota bacterium]